MRFVLAPQRSCGAKTLRTLGFTEWATNATASGVDPVIFKERDAQTLATTAKSGFVRATRCAWHNPRPFSASRCFAAGVP
jgi:hypothetical protein